MTTYAHDTNVHEVQDRLDLKAKLIENYLKSVQQVVEDRAGGAYVTEAMQSLDETSQQYLETTLVPDMAALSERFDYQVENTPSLEGLELPTWTGKLDARGLALQSLYVATNPHPIGEKHLLDSASDGGPYAQAHAKYHPELRGFLDRYSLYDVFLIEPQSGNIIYSVFKEMDFGTSLLSGPYSQSAFGLATKDMIDSNGSTGYTLVDFEPYAPSYDAQAAFALNPIMKDGKLIGIFAIQFPLDFADKILHSSADGSETIDAYLVGEDHRLRSSSRFGENLSVGVSLGYGEMVTHIEENKTGKFEGDNHLGNEVFAAWKPIKIDGLDWRLVSEIGRDEAMALADAARGQAIQIIGGVALALIVLGIFLSRWLIAPVRKLGSELQEQADVAVAMLLETGEQARVSSETMAAAADETNRQTGEIQSSSRQTSSDVSDVATAMDDLSVSIQQVVRGVRDTSNLVGDASTRTEKASELLSELEVAANRITGIVTLIEDIAKQTDLLSLNAAIEASRAGAAGQGFAVVAAEIRKLADRTTLSTEEISEEVRNVFETVERNSEAVRSVSELIGQMNEQAQTISESAEQQGQVTSGISERMNMTAQRVSTDDISLTQVQVASNDVAKAAGDVLGGVQNVEVAASEMEAALSTFVDRVRTL
ncbi:MAG: methyl-accepting chemotaxis protein [Thalassovita sp.]